MPSSRPSAASWLTKRSRKACGALLCALFCSFAAPLASAFVYDTRDAARWPGPTIPVVVQLGAAPIVLQDGSANYDRTVERALALWNQQMGAAQFTWTESARTGPPERDGVTTLSFETAIYGQDLGASTLAITLIRNSGARMQETDIAFNSRRKWDSFVGTLDGQKSEDLHRVALHELGHALGLDHPDQYGQILSAIMNSRVSDVFELQQDDIDGLRSLYGAPATPPPASGNGRLANISTRVRVGTAERVMIGGFIIRDAPKKLLLRALGPSLPLADTLRDPVIELHDDRGAIVAANNDWRETQAQEIRDSTLPPSNDAEAALVVTLAPGAYTAIVSGNHETSGLGLVEIYDLTPGSGRLANISTRGHVDTGNNVMIAGFIIVGPQSKTVVVRALGPSLRSALPSALGDTALELRNGNGDLLTAASGCPGCAGSPDYAGLAPSDPAESAIIQRLVPGNFTAILRSPTGMNGIGLVEVYDVSP